MDLRYVVFDIETQNLFHETESRDPTRQDISVVSAYDSGTDKYTTVSVDELHELWPIFETAEALVGYNSNHFDIPILNKYFPGDLTQIKSIDILEEIKESFGRRLKLDSVAEATIGKGKTADGIQAVRWWREGKVDKVKEYCEADVKATKEVFEYALENGKLLYKDGRNKREIPLDTSNWNKKDDVAMTHSLPF